MLLSWFVSFFSRHFSTGRPLKRQWRGGKGTERPRERQRSESYSGSAPAPPLQQRGTPFSLWHREHWGLICLAHGLCTLLLLVTFWCHGVTVKWLPSHVAACGSTTTWTMRTREVGAGTQEAPAGRNALTLPPPRLPWNRELVEPLLTTSQCLCVPGSSQARRRPGVRRHRDTDTLTEGWERWRSLGATCMYCTDLRPQQRSNSCLTNGTVREGFEFISVKLASVSRREKCFAAVSLPMYDTFNRTQNKKFNIRSLTWFTRFKMLYKPLPLFCHLIYLKLVSSCPFHSILLHHGAVGEQIVLINLVCTGLEMYSFMCVWFCFISIFKKKKKRTAGTVNKVY